VLEVVREVDGGHTAGPEFTVDAVAIGEGGGEAFHDRHWPKLRGERFLVEAGWQWPSGQLGLTI